MAINLAGYLYSDNGTALENADITLIASDASTEATTTTNGSGYWTFAEADEDVYDIKIEPASSTQVRYIKGADKLSVKEIDVRNNAAADTSAFTFTNYYNSASNQVGRFRSLNTTRADNDEIYLSFELADSGGAVDEFARITAVATDVTAGSEDGALVFSVADTDNSGDLQEAFRISSSTGGTISQTFTTNSITFGSGADTDIVINFNANTYDGVITWMEDEDYFKFSDEILMNSTEKILFGDTGTFVHQSSDGVLTITSDTTLDFTSPTVDLNSSTEFNIDTAAYDLNASAAVTIDSAGISLDSSAASNFTTSGGALTITSALAATWSTSAGVLTLNGTGGIAIQEGGATIIGISDARALATTNTAAIDLDGSGAIQINSSGAAISIANDNVDQTVNLATAGTRTLNIGIGDGTDITTTVIKGTVSVGVDDTGYDVKFFGAAAGSYMLWDEDANLLDIRGATAAGPGHLKLTTGELTVVNADVLGRIDFQAPLETGTDAILVSASIQAIAQGTFAANVNATDIVFYTAHDAAAAERFRFTSQGEIGVAGANYGTDGQVLTSGGAGAAVGWGSVAAGIITVRAGETLAAGAPVALENNSGTIEAVNIHGWGNDTSDPTTDNKIYTLQGEMASGKLVSCGSAGIAWVYTSSSSDSQSSGYCYATIGTYSTTTKQIEWSTPVAVTSAAASPVTASWDSNRSRLLIVYSISGANSKGVCYAISSGALVTAGGTAPGAAVDVTGGTTYNEVYIRMEFDSDNNVHHLLYEDGGDSDYLKLAGITVDAEDDAQAVVAIAGTKINGANITAYYGIHIKWGNDKALIVYEDAADSNYCKAIIATHNGSAYSWGSIIEPFGANTFIDLPSYVTGNAIAFDSSNNNWVIGGYETDGDSDVILKIVALTNDLTTDSGTTSYNTIPDYLLSENINPTGADSIAGFSAFASTPGIGIDYDPDRNCVAVVSRINMGDANQGWIDPEYEMIGNQPGHTSAGGNSKYVVTYVTLGGTNDVVLTKGDMKLHHFINRRIDLESDIGASYASNSGFLTVYDTHHNRLFFLSAAYYIPVKHMSLGGNAYSYMADHFSFVFEGAATSGNYEAYSSSNMGQFVGFATAGVTADGSATVTITVKGGVNENQSSLTVGEEYWIGDSGALVTAPPKWSMHMYKAGIATDTDKLYVQNDYSTRFN